MSDTVTLERPAEPAVAGERLLKCEEVLAKAGISRTTLYDRIRRGQFPRPVALADQCVRWRVSEIDRWIAELPTA